jgi:hypothetical protein
MIKKAEERIVQESKTYLEITKGIHIALKPANTAQTTKEVLNPYYQKICAVQRRCRMEVINV